MPIGVSLQTVTARQSHDTRIWPPGRRAIHSGQVCIVVGRPLQTSRLSHHDIARLREQARDVIWAAHRDLVTAMSAKAVS
jgi:hypothetical protein